MDCFIIFVFINVFSSVMGEDSCTNFLPNNCDCSEKGTISCGESISQTSFDLTMETLDLADFDKIIVNSTRITSLDSISDQFEGDVTVIDISLCRTAEKREKCSIIEPDQVSNTRGFSFF